jgi:hypothetical protein
MPATLAFEPEDLGVPVTYLDTSRSPRRVPLTAMSRCRSPEPTRRLAAFIHSARRASAAGVRAALRPGNTATALANTTVPRPTKITDNHGTVGSGTA